MGDSRFKIKNGLLVEAGPTEITGSLIAPSITGSLLGTASWAFNSVGGGSGVGGSGNTNRVAKFTAGTTIGDSNILDNGTSVQITGSTAFLVSVAAASTPSITLTLNNNQDGGHRILFGNSATSTLAAIEGDISSSGAGTNDGVIKFWTATDGSMTEKMRITKEGNIGIGTTNPATKLHVDAGNIFVDNANGSVIVRNADATNQQQIRLRMSGNDGILDVTRNSGTIPNLIFGTEGSEKARIDSNGRLGVNSTSPAAQLDVLSDDGVAAGEHVNIARFARNNSAGAIYLGYIANGSALTATQIRTSNGLPISIGTSTVSQSLTIVDSGNVGIGTISPSQRLEVAGNEASTAKINNVGTVYGAGSFLNAFTTSGGNDLGFAGFIASQLNQVNRFYAGVHSPSGVNQSFIGTPDANPLAFWTNATERMRITSAGDVGIGTTSPSYKLHVFGGNGFINSIILGDDSSYGSPYKVIGFNSTSNGGNRISAASDTSDGMYFAAATGRGFAFRPNGGSSTLMTLDSNGNLGIGATSPSGKLHVNGGIILGTNTDFVLNSAGSGFIINTGASSGNTYSQIYAFQSGNTAYNNLVIPGGNVGISETSPSGKLEVYDNISFSTIDTFPQLSIKSATGTTGNRLNLGVDQTSGLSFIQSVNRGTGAINLILQRYAGNVGIGGDGVGGFKLHVSGTVNTLNSYYSNGVELITSDGSNNYLKTGATLYIQQGSTTRAVIDGSGNFMVGRTAAITQISFDGASGITYQRSTANEFSGVLDYLKSRGTSASPAIVQNGDGIFTLRVAPYQGSTFTYLNSMTVDVDGTFTSGQNPPTKISFYTNAANGSSTDRVTIKNDGYVGIGTTSPEAKLHIGAGNILLDNTNFIAAKDTGGTIRTVLYGRFSDNATYLDAGTGGLYLRTNNSSVNAMYLSSGGNVGVGTLSPQKPLEVITAASDFASVGVRQMAVGEWTGIHFGYREASALYRKSAIVFERTDLTTNNAQGKVHILNGPQAGAGSATLADAKLTIVENGNVGIGTTSPTLGTLQVNGNIYATSFTGSLLGTATSAVAADIVNGTLGQNVSKDDRIIEPNSINSSRMQFGFTSWNNNNTSPYADYLHLRSYTDNSGGNDNLLMFRKDALGIRLWQQTFNSATAYASYKDVAWTDGTNATGTWNITASWATTSSFSVTSSYALAVLSGIVGSGTVNYVPKFSAGPTTLGNSTITDNGTTVELLQGQLKFPATQNPSSDVNTLDDYEEGTWDPIYEPGTNSFTTITYNSARKGTYQKIGNKVFISGYIGTDSLTIGTGGGTLRIANLPFTYRSTYNADLPMITFADVSFWDANPPSMALGIDNTKIVLYQQRDLQTSETVACVPGDMQTGAITNQNRAYFYGFYNT
jgi:hypothetical protein